VDVCVTSGWSVQAERDSFKPTQFRHPTADSHRSQQSLSSHTSATTTTTITATTTTVSIVSRCLLVQSLPPGVIGVNSTSLYSSSSSSSNLFVYSTSLCWTMERTRALESTTETAVRLWSMDQIGLPVFVLF